MRSARLLSLSTFAIVSAGPAVGTAGLSARNVKTPGRNGGMGLGHHSLANLSSSSSFRFTVVEPTQKSACCTSPFFLRLISELRSRPEYTSDPTEADVLFTNVDTLRMCEWPRLRMRPGGLPGCMDGTSWDPDVE